jgi:5-methylcytosine-specific restriction protein B
MALYFGKFSDKYPEQIEGCYYTAGEEGNEWYGGIKVGDYVFPIYKGKIDRLWRVKEYTKIVIKTTGENTGAVKFDEVKLLPSSLRLSDEFTRYRYFNLDLNLVNKSAKSVKKCGFHKISLEPNCPAPEAIEFTNNLRNIYISLPYVQLPYKEGDIRIVIDNKDDYRITGIETFINGASINYEPLLQLYKVRNPEGERYSLKELISYAIDDYAPNKKAYIEAVIKELDSNGFYAELSPIRLYDNILVGRKRSSDTPKGGKGKKDDDNSEDNVDQDVFEEPDLSQFEKYADLLEFNPNLIFYGPPGTGKTYSAMRVIEYLDKKITGNYKMFSQICSEDRAKFVTFHQSYSYEEFIEGIRPQLDAGEDINSDNKSGSIGYKIEDGILKKLAEAAATQKSKMGFEKADELKNVSDKSHVWKMSLGRRNDDTIYNQCIKDEEIALGWLEETDLKGLDYDELKKLMDEYYKKNKYDTNAAQATGIIDIMVSGMRKGDFVLVYNSPYSIRAIGVIDSDYYYSEKDIDTYPHRRKVKWLKVCKNNDEINIYDLNNQVKLTLSSIYQLGRIKVSDVLKLTGENNSQHLVKKNAKTLPYYMVIDEINRGNISRIFGELITLIEKDKRDFLSCNLPYSKQLFSLPSNLYIIGTMNTADRSIAILDTALRRRFVFVEVEPDMSLFDMPDVVPSPKVNGTIELSKLLSSLNETISEMLDRDHRIGHSYFIGINSLSDLLKVWYYKVMPLIMEYFYNDTESIRKVVGDSFIDVKGNVIFLDTKPKNAGLSTFEEALLVLSGANL